MLHLLLKTDTFDKFLSKKFANVKKYGLEGCETMIISLHSLLKKLNHLDYTDVVIGKNNKNNKNNKNIKKRYAS
jgi:probable 2-oxoglutarate dehydrogenase E1 component DHKTD1